MKTMNLLAGTAIAAALLLSNLSVADDLGAAATSLCEKVKSCALEQMNQEQITPQMRQMIEPTLQSMCESVSSSVVDVPKGHELYQPAVACMRSMSQQSCADIMNTANNMTPQCKEYENKTRSVAGPQS